MRWLPATRCESRVVSGSADRSAAEATRLPERRMAEIFRSNIPRIYSIVALLGVFVAVFSDQVIVLFGGSAYSSAASPLTILAFYPIHQTYGQLSGAVLYATGQTPLYRNIGVAMAVVGLVTAYLLLAEQRFGRLNLGATGQAGGPRKRWPDRVSRA